jgi:cation diffusion facilitator family transporter
MDDRQDHRHIRAILAQPETASRLSILVIALLIAMKAVASVLTGSVGIRADAIHSSIDLLGAVVGLLGIRISRRPPDAEHAFGHGKAEAIAGAVIAVLIFGAAGSIVYEAVRRLLEGGSLEYVGLGIYVTAAAIVANVAIAGYALRVARSHESLALEATARDMMADVLSSVAVLIGLLLVRITGHTVADPIVSLLVAALIARTAYITMRQSLDGLMDTRMPPAEEEYIKELLKQRGVAGFHQLRTRKVGSERHIYLHLVMPKDSSVEEAHKVCDDLERDIGEKLQHADVNIHVEPCEAECESCDAACDGRGKSS